MQLPRDDGHREREARFDEREVEPRGQPAAEDVSEDGESGRVGMARLDRSPGERDPGDLARPPDDEAPFPFLLWLDRVDRRDRQARRGNRDRSAATVSRAPRPLRSRRSASPSRCSGGRRRRRTPSAARWRRPRCPSSSRSSGGGKDAREKRWRTSPCRGPGTGEFSPRSYSFRTTVISGTRSASRRSAPRIRDASIFTATSICVGRYGLVVVRPVEPRRGVEPGADRLEDRRDRRPLLPVVLGRALEHQVFEQVRGARVSDGLVTAADVVDDSEGRHRGDRASQQQDLEPIGGEPPLPDARLLAGRRSKSGNLREPRVRRRSVSLKRPWTTPITARPRCLRRHRLR